jgi:hypothetical protein
VLAGPFQLKWLLSRPRIDGLAPSGVVVSLFSSQNLSLMLASRPQ